MSDFKTCTTCQVPKPSDAFAKSSQSPDGKRPNCKECQKEYRRTYYLKNQEHVKAKAAAFRAANPDYIASYMKARREVEPRYGQRTREEARLERSRRRAMEKAATVEPLPKNAWQMLLDVYGSKCMKCGKTENLHLDHIVPLAKGGAHAMENFQILCQGCNTSKGARDDTDYRPVPWGGAVNAID